MAAPLLLTTLPACTTLRKEVRQELEPPTPDEPNNVQLTQAATFNLEPLEVATNPTCADISAIPKPELRDG